MRLLNLRINFFYLLRTFCPHLGRFFFFFFFFLCCFFFHYVSAKLKKKINSQIKKPHLKMISIQDKYKFSFIMELLFYIELSFGF